MEYVFMFIVGCIVTWATAELLPDRVRKEMFKIIFSAIAVAVFLYAMFACRNAIAEFRAKVGNGTITVRTTEPCRVMIQKENDKYHYDLEAGVTVLPLQYGDGKYLVTQYFHVSGKDWQKGKRVTVDYNGDAEEAFLSSNLMVNYTNHSLAVVKAAELCEGLTDANEKASTIYKYIVHNFVYDYISSFDIKQGKAKLDVVDIDDVFAKGKGVCYDLSIMAAAMLRSQGIPARVEIGHGHAWLKVMIGDKEKLMDIAAKLETGKPKAANFEYAAERYF